jgi:hypothetical protein
VKHDGFAQVGQHVSIGTHVRRISDRSDPFAAPPVRRLAGPEPVGLTASFEDVAVGGDAVDESLRPGEDRGTSISTRYPTGFVAIAIDARSTRSVMIWNGS